MARGIPHHRRHVRDRMPDGTYMLGGLVVEVANGRCLSAASSPGQC